jgi:putative DNA primase/helicase
MQSDIEFVNAEAPEGSDDALALRFAERHADRLRFVKAWSRWLIWDDVRWKFDETLHAVDFARAVCREAASECDADGKLATALASAKTVRAIEHLARADRRHATTVDQWDANPWLLNTPRGVVDLRTGATRPPQPDDYMTKVTAVAPSPSCRRRPRVDRVHEAARRLRLDRLDAGAFACVPVRHRSER